MPLKTAHLSSLPGVYIFEDLNQKPLYIGKSINIKTRVKQHLKTSLFVSQAKKISCITTKNDIIAILLEAELIKTYQPKYNRIHKDDKSSPYIVITNPPASRIILVRGRDLLQSHLKNPKTQVFGPFLNKKQALKILKSVKDILGYCQKPFNSLGQPCFYYQIRSCPGACNGRLTPKDYQQHLKLVKNFLSGKISHLARNLNGQINQAAKNQNYERAADLKTKLQNLEYLTATPKIGQFFALPINSQKLMRQLINTLNHPLITAAPKRIEGYDVAHLQTSHYTGAMAVVENGRLSPQEYRLFKLKNPPKGDPQALKEIIARRLKHKDWPWPDLIVLDGGVGQLSTVFPIIPDPIAAIALSKHRESLHFYNHQGKLINLNLPLSHPVLSLFRLLRDEAHRLATTLHRRSRDKIQPQAA